MSSILSVTKKETREPFGSMKKIVTNRSPTVRMLKEQAFRSMGKDLGYKSGALLSEEELHRCSSISLRSWIFIPPLPLFTASGLLAA